MTMGPRVQQRLGEWLVGGGSGGTGGGGGLLLTSCTCEQHSACLGIQAHVEKQ